MPVMNISGRKLAMMASVERISAGCTSCTALSTASRALNRRMLKYRAIFSTPVIGSSTSRPSDRIRANRVTRLMVYPTRKLMNSVKL